MDKKTTEEIILDFCDRFKSDGVEIEVDKRTIRDNVVMMWFTVRSEILLEDGLAIHVEGQSYSLDGALGMLHQSALKKRKPQVKPRRKKIVSEEFHGMDGIFQYE